MLCVWGFLFQRIGRKKRIGKLTEDCSFESCLERYGRKESETRQGSSRKVILCKRLRGEGKINNTGLSTLETEIAKSSPISWGFVFHGLV